MGVRLLTPPAVEPVSLAELKAHLNVAGDGEDVLLATLTVVARTAVERMARRALITQTVTVTLDGVPPGGVIALPVAPVQAVAAVRVTRADGSVATWPGASLTLDLAGEPARLAFAGAPPVPGRPIGGLAIDVVAGYGPTGAAVPPPLVQAVKLLAAHWYATRGDAVAAAVPADVLALTADYRVRRLVA